MASHVGQRGRAGVVGAFETSFELGRVVVPAGVAESVAVAWVERVVAERVVDEDVDASEGVGCGLCEFVDLGFVGHVGFACDDASLCVRFVFDVLLGVLGAFVVA